MRKRLVALAAIALGATLGAEQQSPPAFRSGVEVVTLDVRVVDRNGSFVGDLAAGDLRVFEDGREQTVSSFNLVNIPVRPDVRPLFDGRPVDADVASNAAAPGGGATGRLYVLLLDDLHTNPGRSASVRAQAREFLERHFNDADRAVVLTTSGRVKVAQEFTNNRERLLAAVEKFEGGFDARAHCAAIGLADGTAIDTAACACADDRAGFQSLSAIASWLVPMNGERKALLLFGEGLASAQAQTADVPGRTVPAPVTADPDLLAWKLGDPSVRAACDGISGDRQEAAGNAARANVTVYPLDPRSNADSLFTQIVADTSSYYLLGYVPTNDKHDGTFRRIEIRARRPGLTVQARTGYTAKNDAAKKPATPAALSPALTELMATPVPTSGLTMSLAAPVFLGTSAKASVELIVDIAGRDLTLTPDQAGGKGSLELLAAVADASGKVEATEHGTLNMTLTEATRAAVAEHGLRVLSRLDVPPGRYVLRLAGVDAAGATRGSVQYDLEVPDFSKTPLTMSSLALSSAAESERPTTGSDRAWRERFAEAPTTLRAFAESDELAVSGEIYRNGPNIGDVDVTTTVRSVSGSELFRRRFTLTDGASGTPSTLRHQSTISLQGLDSGDYLLTVEARAGEGGERSASRQVPFTVK